MPRAGLVVRTQKIDVQQVLDAITWATAEHAAGLEAHASYIASWLKALKDDKRAVFAAAVAHAQRAADYLARVQPQAEQDRAAA